MKLRKHHNIKLVPFSRKSSAALDHPTYVDEKSSKAAMLDHLTHLAFDNSLLPNIISIVSDGKIIAANESACKLFGYSKRDLISRYMKDIFIISDKDFKGMAKRRDMEGHVITDINVVKNGGKELSCQITSVVFTGDNNIKKAITTFVDKSASIRKQKAIDLVREKQITNDLIFAQSKSKATLNRLDKLERTLDKEISMTEQLKSSSRLQEVIFKKEMEDEIKLKEIQIADAITVAKELERSDLGKELHDNINQLLVASKLYIEIARKDKEHSALYLNRSTEYTLSAIEEIRKLTKGLISDAIQDLGLCDAIENMTRDIMEMNPVKITCKMDVKVQVVRNPKFNLNIFRIVQEQLNNIIKHAKASIVQIGYAQNDTSIILLITDNGLGFDTTKKNSGIGMLNIKSRAKFFKGRADFLSKPGKGCTLTVTFPVKSYLDKNI